MKKYIIQVGIGLLFAAAIIFYRMPQMEEGTAGVLMAVSDGFTVTGLLYICFGILLFASGTGFFDFLGYASHRVIEFFIPRLDKGTENYYEYKVKKQEERKKFSLKSTLLVGLGFVGIAVIFTMLWYQTV
ncbi:MAG: DUF3899 domain-containing protein [Lachnospiraceae bacterium]|nr:DUF3899 domain-containing protein [Lachnospiraceae bacterium]MBP3595718.1 DUF3899 domain-containing protein [Lachnospiraceae bacterium]